MMKFLFKYLLSANYSFARRWVNKKTPGRIIPSTLHTFTTPFTFIFGGLYVIFIVSIDYKFESFLPIFIGLGIVLLPASYLIEKKAEKAIEKWEIEKEHESLSKEQRSHRNTFAFIFFFVGLALSFYLIITFGSGYLVQS